jgi:hypothetical protein
MPNSATRLAAAQSRADTGLRGAFGAIPGLDHVYAGRLAQACSGSWPRLRLLGDPGPRLDPRGERVLPCGGGLPRVERLSAGSSTGELVLAQTEAIAILQLDAAGFAVAVAQLRQEPRNSTSACQQRGVLSSSEPTPGPRPSAALSEPVPSARLARQDRRRGAGRNRRVRSLVWFISAPWTSGRHLFPTAGSPDL